VLPGLGVYQFETDQCVEKSVVAGHLWLRSQVGILISRLITGA
jgi:hypothetical protein